MTTQPVTHPITLMRLRALAAQMDNAVRSPSSPHGTGEYLTYVTTGHRDLLWELYGALSAHCVECRGPALVHVEWCAGHPDE